MLDIGSVFEKKTQKLDIKGRYKMGGKEGRGEKKKEIRDRIGCYKFDEMLR